MSASGCRYSLNGTYNGKVFKTAEIKGTLDITLQDYPANITICTAVTDPGFPREGSTNSQRGCANLLCWKNSC